MTTQTTTTIDLPLHALTVDQLCDAVENFTNVGTQLIADSGFLNGLSFDSHTGHLVAKVAWSHSPDPSALNELVERLARGEVKPLKPRLTLPPTPKQPRAKAHASATGCGCGGTTKASCACESRSLESSTATEGDSCEWVTLPIITNEVERAQALHNFRSFSECIGVCSAEDCSDVIPVVLTRGGPAVGWCIAMRAQGEDLQVSVRWIGHPRPIAGVHAIDRIEPETGANTGLAIHEVIAVAGPMLRRRPLPQQQATNRTERTTMQTNTNTTPKMPAPGTVTNVREARAHLSNTHPMREQLTNDQMQAIAVTLRDMCNDKNMTAQLSRAPGPVVVLLALFPGATKLERAFAYLATVDAEWNALTYDQRCERAAEFRRTHNIIDAD